MKNVSTDIYAPSSSNARVPHCTAAALLNFSTSASSSHNSGKGWLPIDRKISKDFPSAEEAAIQWAAGQIIVQCLLWGQLCNCFDVVADMEVQMRVGGVKELQVTEHKAAAGGSSTGLSLWRPWGGGGEDDTAATLHLSSVAQSVAQLHTSHHTSNTISIPGPGPGWPLPPCNCVTKCQPGEKWICIKLCLSSEAEHEMITAFYSLLTGGRPSAVPLPPPHWHGE